MGKVFSPLNKESTLRLDRKNVKLYVSRMVPSVFSAKGGRKVWRVPVEK